MKKDEIEHKYILKSLPDLQKASKLLIIEQYYIQRSATASTRVRLEHDPHHGQQFTLTRKEGKGRTRSEVELLIDKEVFDILKKMSFGAIFKERYLFERIDSDFLWSLDIFKDKLQGLLLLEGELKKDRIDTGTVVIPVEFQNLILADVTNESGFTNLFLSVLEDQASLIKLLEEYGWKNAVMV
jgi:CYTH domain-containing protein